MATGRDAFTLTVFPMYPGSSGNSGELIGSAEAPLTADDVLRFGEAIVDAARRVAAGEFDDRDDGRPDVLDMSLIGPFATVRPALTTEPVHPITRLQVAASDNELAVQQIPAGGSATDVRLVCFFTG